MKEYTTVPTLWFRWLVIATIGVMLFGVSMMVFPNFIRQFFSLLIYSSAKSIQQFEPGAVKYITLVHGVLGAVMFGWGILLLTTLLGPFRQTNREAWLMLAISIAAWFFPDTLLSLWTGFWQNAILNLGFAILFAVPLAATYSTFKTNQA